MTDDPLSASGLDRQFGFALREANGAVWNDLRRTLDPCGLKPQTYAILLIVGASPGCKQQAIADALSIQRPNLVALIDSLGEQGVLERRVNADDRRSYTVFLTEPGRALLDRARAAHVEHEARVAAALGDYGWAEALRILSGLASI